MISFFLSPLAFAESSLLDRAEKDLRKEDITLVKHLSDISLKLTKERFFRINPELKRVHALSLKSKLFNSYSPILEDMTTIFRNQSLNKLASVCLGFVQSHGPYNDRMLTYFASETIDYCDKKIIKGYRASEGEKEYLTNRISSFVQTNNKKITHLLRKDLTLKDRLYFEELIKNKLYEKKILPARGLLDHLSIDQKLTRYLQERKFFEVKDRRIYQRQLYQTLADFKEAYLNEEEEKAKAKLKEALDFFSNHQEFLDSHKSWQSLLNTGLSLLRQDNYEVAINLFEASKEIAEEENQFESKFQALFALFLKEDYKGVINYAFKEKLLENPNVTSRIRYWVAYAIEKSGNPKSAEDIYRKQIQNFPMDFYSIITLKRLQGLSEKNITMGSIVKETAFPKDFELTTEAYQELLRLVAFSKVGEDRFTSKQVQNLLSRSEATFFKNEKDQKDSVKRKLLIKTLSELDQHLPSFKLAYQSLHHGHVSLDYDIIKSLFPLKYLSQVSKLSKKVNPLIVLSLIRQESAFNPRARSRVGARGLMQLMPRTARQYKRRLRASELYSPKTNLKIGIKYLNRLVKKYDGDIIHALAAYNAGEGNVKKWTEDILSRENKLAKIELIPFEETRNYIKLVYRNYFFYNYLAKKEKGLEVSPDTSFEVAQL